MNHEHHFTLIVDELTQEALEVVFPGGPVISSVDWVMQNEFKQMARSVSVLCKRRKDVAISGAMRWPWSQEYAMSHPKLEEMK
jgi:hypothetical protein